MPESQDLDLAIATGHPVWLCPTEADAAAGRDVGVVATTDRSLLARAHVLLLGPPEWCTAQREALADVATEVLPVAAGDFAGLAEFFECEMTRADLDRLVALARYERGDHEAFAAAPEPEKPPDPFRHPNTDLGNSERLIDAHGQDLLYAYPWKSWVIWDGRRHRRDDLGEIDRRIKLTVRATYEAAEAEEAAADEAVREHQRNGDDKAAIAAGQRGELAKAAKAWARKSEMSQRLTACEHVARSARPADHEAFDLAPYLITVANGTLDLKTGQLGPHRREDLITKIAPVAYDARAECPRWERFLLEIMMQREELVRFLQRAMGASLTADVSDQVLIMLHGEQGRNGKSTMLNLMGELWGEYGRAAAPNLLLERKSEAHPTELADLFRARLVTVQEPDESKAIAEALVKLLTGGDRIKARRMREDFWEFSPTHHFWLSCNNRPVIKGTDNAIWRRILAVPFEFVAGRDAPEDRHLPLLLRAELPGILAWCVRGCLEWQHAGLAPPDIVVTTSTDYREQMDLLLPFFDSRCAMGVTCGCPSGDLYNEYKRWAAEQGHQHPMSAPHFGRRIKALPGVQEVIRNAGERRIRCWAGIGIRSGSDL